MRNTGVCKWFNPRKGFGFITRDDNKEDIFVHQTAIYASGFRSLDEGEQIEFDIEENSGKIVAVNVSGPGGNYVKGSQRKFNNTTGPTNNTTNNTNTRGKKFMPTDEIQNNLEMAEKDLLCWGEKTFNREKVEKRLSFLKDEYERNEIYRITPENRLTMELEKSVDYWKNRLDLSRKYSNDNDDGISVNQ
jgi:cold shock CspA family protein